MFNAADLRNRLYENTAENNDIFIDSSNIIPVDFENRKIDEILIDAVEEFVETPRSLQHKREFEWEINQPVYKQSNENNEGRKWFKLNGILIENAVCKEDEPVILISHQIENSSDSENLCKLLYLARIMWERQCLMKSSMTSYKGEEIWIPIIHCNERFFELRLFYSRSPVKVDFKLTTLICLKESERERITVVTRNLLDLVNKNTVPYQNKETFDFPGVKLAADKEHDKCFMNISICALLKETGEFDEPFDFLFLQDKQADCNFVTLQTFSSKYNKKVTVKMFSSDSKCFEDERKMYEDTKDLDYSIPTLLETKTVPGYDIEYFVFEFYDKFDSNIVNWENLLLNGKGLVRTLQGFHDIAPVITGTCLGMINERIVLTSFCRCEKKSLRESLKSLKSFLKGLDRKLPLNVTESSKFYKFLADLK